MKRVVVIGAGLAGSECAWQLAKADIEVHLYEMRPCPYTLLEHEETSKHLFCKSDNRCGGLYYTHRHWLDGWDKYIKACKGSGACSPPGGNHAGFIDKIHYLKDWDPPTHGTCYGATASIEPKG